MTTTNEFGKEVFTNTSMVVILTFAIKEGIERSEQVIKNTFCKDDAKSIIQMINSAI